MIKINKIYNNNLKLMNKIIKYSNLMNISTSTLNLKELEALNSSKYRNCYVTGSITKTYYTQRMLLMPILFLNKYTKEDIELSYINKLINSLCPEKNYFYAECYNHLYVQNNSCIIYDLNKIEESHANVKITLPTKLAGSGLICDERPIAMSDPYKVLKKIIESSVSTEIQK